MDVDETQLPSNWTAHESKSRWPGRVYYYNCLTGECTWERPQAPATAGAGAASSTSSSSAAAVAATAAAGGNGNGSGASVSVRKRHRDEGAMVDEGAAARGSVTSAVEELCEKCHRAKIPVSQFEDAVDAAGILHLLVESAKRSRPGVCVCTVVTRMGAFLGALAELGESGGAGAAQMSLSVDARRKAAVSIGAGTVGHSFSREMDFDVEMGGSPIQMSDFDTGFDDDRPTEMDRLRSRSFDLESGTRPTIALDAYLERLWKYARVSDAVFVAALVYIIRLARSARLPLNARNIFKALLASTMASAKFNEDATLTNKSFAVLGGMSLREVNAIEEDFIQLLRWRLSITKAEWIAAVNTLGAVVTREDALALAHDCMGTSAGSAVSATGDAAPMATSASVASAAAALAPMSMHG